MIRMSPPGLGQLENSFDLVHYFVTYQSAAAYSFKKPDARHAE
jgi:hypothetical protein